MIDFQEDLDQLANGIREFQSSVSIYFPHEDNPYVVPRQLLEDNSDYFRDRLQNSNQRMFHLMIDSVMVWHVILYWLSEKFLPDIIWENSGYQRKIGIDCYVVAEEYGFKAFQDDMMSHIFTEIDFMRCANRWETMEDDGGDALCRVFTTSVPTSKLREVFVEEAVNLSRRGVQAFGVKLSREHVSQLDGTGFFEMYIEKHAQITAAAPLIDKSMPLDRYLEFIADGEYWLERRKDSAFSEERYMVGPKKD